ncbi:MAG: invasion associated locus B family protein [Pseudomonadota bacterium]
MKRILMAGAISTVAGFGTFATMTADSANAQGLRSNGWYKACSDQGNNKICNVQYQAVASTGQVVTSINLADIKGDNVQRIFQITVPTGRAIPPGIELQIDGKKANAIPYAFCTPRICAAQVALDDNLVGTLKAGGEMLVVSTNFQGRKNPIPVTLKGFTAAFDGPPIKQEDLQKRNEELAKQLEQKAEEARQKLQEAQNAATQDSTGSE